MASVAVLGVLLASVALTLVGLRRRSWPSLLLASILALGFCVPEAPAVGFFILAMPMLQFALGVWYVVRIPTPVRALLCAAAAAVFITQVPPVLARILS